MTTVYVADRDAGHRRGLARALRRRGLRVVEFASGSELYAGVLVGRPELVLLDVDLEEMDGFQVFARLLRKCSERPLPLVFLTEFTRARVVEVCLQRGALGYLRKGEPPERIAETALELMSGGASQNGCPADGEKPRDEACPGGSIARPGSRHRRIALVAASLAATLAVAAAAAILARRGPAPASAEPAPASTSAPVPRPSSGPADSRPGRTLETSRAEIDEPAGATVGSLAAVSVQRIAPDEPEPAGGLAGPSAAEPAPDEAVPRPAPAFHDAGERILAGLGLAVPPGARLDASNSDVRPAAERGGSRGAHPARVLTFRSGSEMRDVLDFYRRRGARFDRKVVELEGRFQGVERTIARGKIRLPGGGQATLTITRPGIDLASDSLVPQTTLRVDVTD